MPIKVKLDEALSPLVAAPLVQSGHQVHTVREQGWGGLKDDELWSRVSAEGIFFITPDKGFSDIRVYPPGGHAGILVLRPDRNSIVEYRSLVEGVLASTSLDSLGGAVAVATPRSLRVRRASVEG